MAPDIPQILNTVNPGIELAPDRPVATDGTVTVPPHSAPIVVAQNFGSIEIAQSNALPAPGVGAPIGQISESIGSVSVTRVDGTTQTLSVGANIYQGDVVETGAESSTSIIFVDDTIFSMDDDAQMVIDEMIYDPATQSGNFSAQVVKGVFSFVSGNLAKTSPDGMMLSTPTTTIGIRGSTVLGQAGPEGTENKITLVRDVDGNVGEIVISNAFGSVVLSQAGATTSVFSLNDAPGQVVILSPQDIQRDFGSTLTKLVKTVAQKAQNDAQAAQDNANQAQADAEATAQDAQQAQEEAAAAEQALSEAEAATAQAEAEAQAAEAEAEALAAQAEAARLAAEASGDPQALAEAQALETEAAQAFAQAQDLQDQVALEAAQIDELQLQAQNAALAAQETAELAALSEQEALDAIASAQQQLQYSGLAGAAAEFQEQVFTDFMETGVLDVEFLPGDIGLDGLAGEAGLADTILDGPIGPDDDFDFDPFLDSFVTDPFGGPPFGFGPFSPEEGFGFFGFGPLDPDFLFFGGFFGEFDSGEGEFEDPFPFPFGDPPSGVILFGTPGNDTLEGGAQDDELYGDEGNDTLIGGDGNDKLFGEFGDDTLNGGSGNDELYGDDGDDTLDGGSGNDILNGGNGADNLTGGAGADIFVYEYETHSQSGSGIDHITDFNAGGDGSAGVDVIEIHDAWSTGGFSFNKSLTDTGGNTILWTGNGSIEAMLDTNGETTLKFDMDGDGTFDGNDMEIDVSGYTGTFDDSDFEFIDPFAI